MVNLIKTHEGIFKAILQPFKRNYKVSDEELKSLWVTVRHLCIAKQVLTIYMQRTHVQTYPIYVYFMYTYAKMCVCQYINRWTPTL